MIQAHLSWLFIQDGEIPLHRACACGYLNIVSLLIKAGSNLYSFDEDGYLPIHRAVIWDFFDITALLLTKMPLNSTLDVVSFAFYPFFVLDFLCPLSSVFCSLRETETISFTWQPMLEVKRLLDIYSLKKIFTS
jgi:uncharacterized protein (UPF0248 family)